MVVIGVISFGIKGLSKGIDFSGGRNYVVRFQEPVNTQEIANLLKPYFEGSSLSVITIGGENQVRVSTNYRIAENDDAIDKEIEMKLYDGLKSMLGGKTLDQFKSDNIMSIQKVGPSIAEDITIGAIWAVILSLIAIALYILLRFRDISFSAGTLVSLAFDTVIIISFYSLFYGLLPFSMEIDQSFIAAILTVIGYSVNDKVVVFDRVREVIGLYPKRDRYLVVNEALNSTLARTIRYIVKYGNRAALYIYLGWRYDSELYIRYVIGGYSRYFLDSVCCCSGGIRDYGKKTEKSSNLQKLRNKDFEFR